MSARRDTAAEAAVRAEVRPWMEAHATRFGPATGHQRLRDTAEAVAACRRWQAELDEGGWGAVGWPVELGGRGYGPVEARVVREEEHRFAVPSGAFHIAVGMVGPTLISHGTPEQRDRFLPAMRAGEHVWCQLFSEPDAGSDLTALRTRAIREGDEWVVTGQKVWTSGARHSDWGILLARTGEAPTGRNGITYFLVDMTRPGIEIRPLVQINGASHFNEVVLDEVRIPHANIVGEIDGGWPIARATLGAERMMIGSIAVSDRVDRLIEEARRNGRNTDPQVRQSLASVWCLASTVTFLGDRVFDAVRLGGPIGPEASVIKLGLSRLMENLGEVAMDVLGPDGLLAGEGDDGYGDLQDQFLGQWAARIGGGTEQIQRNQIGERALGLPREPS